MPTSEELLSTSQIPSLTSGNTIATGSPNCNADLLNNEYANTSFTEDENAMFKNIRRDAANFEDYEQQFQEVLMTLENNDVLDGFRSEYSGLHHSFLKSHEGENRLIRKCLDLHLDIVSCISKAQAAENLTQGDKQTIADMQDEIERSRRKASQIREKEATLREKIAQLKKEVTDLELTVAEPVEVVVQEAALKNLLRVHDMVTKEKETQEGLINSVKLEIGTFQRSLQKLQEVNSGHDMELRTICNAIEVKQEEANAILRVKQSKEEELRAVRDDLSKRNSLLISRQARIEQLRGDLDKHQNDIRKTLEERDRLAESYHILCRDLQNVNNSLQECNEENDVLQKNIREAMAELKASQANVVEAHKHYVKEAKLLSALRMRNTVAERKQAEAEKVRDELTEQVRRGEEEILKLRVTVAMEEKKLDSLHREQDLLHQKRLSVEQQHQRNKLWLAEKASQLNHAEHELAACESFAQKQTEEIYHVSKECTMYEDRSKKHVLQAAILLGEVQAHDQQLVEMQKQVKELEHKLVQQNTVLESVIQDRAHHVLQCHMLQTKLREISKQFKLLLMQSHQLKESILNKDRDIAAEEEKIANAKQHNREICLGISSLQQQTEKKRHFTTQFNGEVNKLGVVLTEAQEEVKSQQHRCADIVHERDFLTRQVVQRQQTLKSLRERFRLQQTQLQRAEALYRERVLHLDQLHYQTTRLTQRLEGMRAFAARLPELQILVNNASRELGKAMANVRTLRDAAEKPLNLHPNNQLAWSEPETFAMANRVQQLQREIGDRRRLLESIEQLISQTEGEYFRDKAKVARQPGPEVAEQLSSYQAMLVKKKAQLRQLQESLEYFREQTNVYRERHDELREELEEMTRAYVVEREKQEAKAKGTRENLTQGVPSQEDGGDAINGEDSDEGPAVYTGFVAPALVLQSTPQHQLQPW